MKAHIENHYFENFCLVETLTKLIDQNNYELKESHLTEDLKEFLIYQLNKLKQCRDFVKKEVRFDYLSIQNVFDETYATDPTLTGMMVKYVYKDVPKEKMNLGLVTVELFKKE